MDATGGLSRSPTRRGGRAGTFGRPPRGAPLHPRRSDPSAARPATRGAAGAGELFGKRRADEGLHTHVVPDAVLLERSRHPAGDARGELYELVVVERFHVF